MEFGKKTHGFLQQLQQDITNNATTELCYTGTNAGKRKNSSISVKMLFTVNFVEKILGFKISVKVSVVMHVNNFLETSYILPLIRAVKAKI